MSSGGLAGHFSSPDEIPQAYLFSLLQVVYAAGCVNFFFFAFILGHARTYFSEEGWKTDNWFFRVIVSNLVLLSFCSIGLSSAASFPFLTSRPTWLPPDLTPWLTSLRHLQAAHWVLESAYRGTFIADKLNWIDVVQRLLAFPAGILANAFFTYRTFQISDSQAVWILCLCLWIPSGVGFLLAEIFHIWTLSDFRWGPAWRICELVGTGGLFALDVFYFVVLSYRLYICRRRQIKPTEDTVSQYFLGTLQVSFLTCAVAIGNLVTIALSLASAQSSIYYSFFLLILPNCWATSVIWAINQRVTIRKRMRSTISDDASLAKRLEVVGWRTTIPTVEGCFDGQFKTKTDQCWTSTCGD
ncbi:hypothetical protein JCM11491_000935 [Sporobolomyces phaffii]